MAEETQVDVQRLRDLAHGIGAILDEHEGQFDPLYGYAPDLGGFEAATWLEALVTDRRDEILAHVAYLRATLADITAALTGIAGDYDETETANAAAVQRLLDPPDR